MLMKKILLIKRLLCLLLSFIFFTSALFSATTFAATTTVGAKVGEFTLSISGFVSPSASVTMRDGTTFYTSVTADQNGNFSISGLVIKSGFSGFCLYIIDKARLGDSSACFTFPPATGNINMQNIFLPPTISLSQATVTTGTQVIVTGYTMPAALVTVYLGTSYSYITTANSAGYYQFKLNNISAGNYTVSVTASYQGRRSEVSVTTRQLTVISLAEAMKNTIQDQIAKTKGQLLEKDAAKQKLEQERAEALKKLAAIEQKKTLGQILIWIASLIIIAIIIFILWLIIKRSSKTKKKLREILEKIGIKSFA